LFLPLQAYLHLQSNELILIWTLIIIAVAVALATAVLVWVARVLLLRLEILDRPNDRSSHIVPTPRGGGLGLMAVLLPTWLIISISTSGMNQIAVWAIPLVALLLATVSWVDDLRTLGALPRLGVQFVATIAGVLMLPGLVFQGLLPPWLDATLVTIGWIWFVNLFNFMDGIDGISGVEAISIGIGILLVGLVTTGGLTAIHLHGLVIAAAAFGFLVWNWPPAKIFLGEIGSVPLGYLLGWLLLALAASGQWEAALILPLYYLADATLTLLQRLRRGEKVWQAHRGHFYQQAVQNGRTHGQVSTAVGLINAVLIVLAVTATTVPTSSVWQYVTLAGAVLLVVLLLVWMKRRTFTANNHG
jgi:UDP-N-acetylmuramyl pentapeptide phosphotransferase/UDP-N-acetylglucosamine-1-phosphate transferase